MNERLGRTYNRVARAGGVIAAPKPRNYGPTVTKHKLTEMLKTVYHVTIGKHNVKKEVDMSLEVFIVLSNQRPYCECCHTTVPARNIPQHCAGIKHQKASDSMKADRAKDCDGLKVQSRMQAENASGSTNTAESHESNLNLLRAFAAGNVPAAAVEQMKASNIHFCFLF